MQALRIHPAPPNSTPYSPSNPAPLSAMQLDKDVPIPKPSEPGELLVRVKASTVIRDMLTWPETYYHQYAILGNDFSGVVVEAFPGGSKFKPGDEVFGMVNVERAATWAEYTIVKEDEVVMKSTNLTWEQAAALPLSGQTAYEALFDQAGVPIPKIDVITNKAKQRSDQNRETILITGAAGGVGTYLVQLASLAGLHVVAATSSIDRNAEFLRGLGADEAIEYSTLKLQDGLYEIIIDTIGGDVLTNCWQVVKDEGTIITVESSSFNFFVEHERRGLRKESVKAMFFIVAGSPKALHSLARFPDLGLLRVFVLDAYPLAEARVAYEHASGRWTGRGKIDITI